MIQDLQNILKTFGLSPKEAQVYLGLLELGSSAVQKIARKSELPRASVYDILDELAKKGLVSTFAQKGVKHYTAENPEKLFKLAQDRARLLESALPQLQALYQSPQDRPMVRLFYGKEGMKVILEEVLESKSEFLTFSSAEDLFIVLDDYFPEFVKRRVALKIPARVITRDSAKARERKQLGSKELRQVRLISAAYDFHGMKMIFGNKVALFTFYKDLIAVLIESEELAKIERAQFELVWKTLSK
ncbi:MAG: helix-turn-helix domain-containing protein [Patescibacteria group bacterium]